MRELNFEPLPSDLSPKACTVCTRPRVQATRMMLEDVLTHLADVLASQGINGPRVAEEAGALCQPAMAQLAVCVEAPRVHCA